MCMLTDSLKQNHVLETAINTAKDRYSLQKTESHCHVHISPAFESILSQLNLFYILIYSYYLFKVYYNIIFPFKPRFSK
jgi:hypothetical protein